MNTSFGELLRLPTLIHHYFEHSELDNYNFIEFLSEHYSKQINHQDDKHHDHENLPFKSLNSQGSQLLTFITHSNYSVNFIYIETVEIKTAVLNEIPHSNTFLNSIWQPPRFS